MFLSFSATDSVLGKFIAHASFSDILFVLTTGARLAKVNTDAVFDASSETTVLYPENGGNLHCFTARTACAVLDVMGPPYNRADGRDCSYYDESPYLSSFGELLTIHPSASLFFRIYLMQRGVSTWNKINYLWILLVLLAERNGIWFQVEMHGTRGSKKIIVRSRWKVYRCHKGLSFRNDIQHHFVATPATISAEEWSSSSLL